MHKGNGYISMTVFYGDRERSFLKDITGQWVCFVFQEKLDTF